MSFGEAVEAALLGDGLAAPPDGLEAVGVGAMLKVVEVTTPLNGPLEELFPPFAAGTSVVVALLPPFPPTGGKVPVGGTPAIDSKLAQAIRVLLAK